MFVVSCMSDDPSRSYVWREEEEHEEERGEALNMYVEGPLCWWAYVRGSFVAGQVFSHEETMKIIRAIPEDEWFFAADCEVEPDVLAFIASISK